MTKETELRIHNVTATAVLKFCAEAWVFEKSDQHKLKVKF
jgi:hypothetical protein